MSLTDRLDRAWKELLTAGGLPARDTATWSVLRYLQVHHSTALNGNALNEREVHTLLDDGLTANQKPLRDHVEVRAYADAVAWIQRQPSTVDQPVTTDDILHLHRTLMAPLWSITPLSAARPGRFRTGGNTKLIPVKIERWVAGTTKPKRATEEPIGPELTERLAWLHSEFHRIRPFDDGNELVNRLLTNLILVRLGYPPLIVFKRQADDYEKAVEQADHQDLADLFAIALEDSIKRFVTRSVPLNDLVCAEFSLAALRQAARRGRLEATQGPDGVWRSTPEALAIYQRSRFR